MPILICPGSSATEIGARRPAGRINVAGLGPGPSIVRKGTESRRWSSEKSEASTTDDYQRYVGVGAASSALNSSREDLIPRRGNSGNKVPRFVLESGAGNNMQQQFEMTDQHDAESLMRLKKQAAAATVTESAEPEVLFFF